MPVELIKFMVGFSVAVFCFVPGTLIMYLWFKALLHPLRYGSIITLTITATLIVLFVAVIPTEFADVMGNVIEFLNDLTIELGGM